MAGREAMDFGTDRMIALKDGAVGWIVFNNPARHNAVSLDMWRALGRIVDSFASDPAIRVVVVRGAGERAFVSGADISEFDEKRATPAQIETYDTASEESCRKLELLAKPTIAMIRGYCIGGGLDLALRCDLRIASTDATFGVPAARLGLGYPFADVKRLADLVGPAATKEIFFLGRRFTAEEAIQMRLVNKVVPQETLQDVVLSHCETIAANAPLTVGAVKQCVAEALKDPTERDLATCAAMVDACFRSADYIEGRTAFVEKRRPIFQGT